MLSIRVDARCPHCLSSNIQRIDLDRASHYTPELLFTAYRCECGKSFTSTTRRLLRPGQNLPESSARGSDSTVWPLGAGN
jgi:transposase-like protein